MPYSDVLLQIVVLTKYGTIRTSAEEKGGGR